MKKSMIAALAATAMIGGTLGYVEPASAATYVTSHDVNGDGVADAIYRDGGTITITASGVTRSYFVGSWTNMWAYELDGRAGLDLAFKVGSSMIVVSYVQNKTMSFLVGSWTLMKYLETDGNPGGELVFPNQGTCYILSAYNNQLRPYVTIPWSTMQNIQLDGVGGQELVFYGSGTYPLVVNDTNKTAYYKYN